MYVEVTNKFISQVFPQLNLTIRSDEFEYSLVFVPAAAEHKPLSHVHTIPAFVNTLG